MTLSRSFRWSRSLLILCAVVGLSELLDDRQASAGVFEIWAQGHGGYTGGAGSDVFGDGAGMGQYGFAAGVEVMYIDAFIDIRLQDALDGGTWNQLGIGWDLSFEIGPVVPFFGVRAGYVYAQFTEDARAAYLEENKDDSSASKNPSNKGLNLSVQGGIDVELIGPLYVGAMVDVGYHMLLPDLTMGANFHGLGYLKFSYSLF